MLFLWRRASEPSRLPREKLSRAIVSGVRYIANSPSIRIVLTRTLVTGLLGGSVSALMPLVARDLLHGGAQTYGIMLGAFGMGAVIGALNIAEVRKRLSGEASVRVCAITMGLAIAVIAISKEPVITAAALVLAGSVWMLAVALFNIGVQLSAPRWVAGRSLAAFQAAIAGGIAIGSWGWGHLTDLVGVEMALLVSAAAMFVSPLLGLWLTMPPIGGRNEAADLLADPEVRLPLTGRSGPLVVEIEYRVHPDSARVFHGLMQEVQLSRQRNGAYGWSIARDIADPELWTERYHCPTWLDYLRQRNRSTQSERDLHLRAIAFHIGVEPIRVRRMLERPFGSVRWKEDTPDRAASEVLPAATPAGAVRSDSARRVRREPGMTVTILPVIRQHLRAGLAQPCAVLLETPRMTMSPWSIRGRQNRDTSRANRDRAGRSAPRLRRRAGEAEWRAKIWSSWLPSHYRTKRNQRCHKRSEPRQAKVNSPTKPFARKMF